MTIKKFKGETKEEAIEAARRELGAEVVIMNVKDERGEGFFSVFKKPSFEVTAALEDGVLSRPSYEAEPMRPESALSRFSAVSDEAANPFGTGNADVDTNANRTNRNLAGMRRATRSSDVTNLTGHAETAGSSAGSNVVDGSINEDELRNAFREVGEVIGAGKIPTAETHTYDRNANIIHSDEIQNIRRFPKDRPNMDTADISDLYKDPEFLAAVQNSQNSEKQAETDNRTAPIYGRPRTPAASMVSNGSGINGAGYAGNGGAANTGTNRSAATVSKLKAQVQTEQAEPRMPEVTRISGNTKADSQKKAMGFVKKLYEILLENEVDERYINRMIEEMDNIISSGNNLDYMLSSVYQKMMLMLGKPKTIDDEPPKKQTEDNALTPAKPKLVFLIGPTGVGKTTTIGKLAAKYKLDRRKNVAFITSDTYRIAAADQLKTYADILQVPMMVVYKPEEFNDAVSKVGNSDLIFVDTTGFSHKNEAQRENLKELLAAVDESFPKEIYLVLSVGTKYRDLREVIDSYAEFTDFRLLFTKLDETTAHGNILNCKLYSGADLSYVTMGQDVPNDIEVADTQALVKRYLGGR